MKKLRIISQRRAVIEQYSGIRQSLVPVCFFSRHLRRRQVAWRYKAGVCVYALPGGFFAHCFPSGFRFISDLPF